MNKKIRALLLSLFYCLLMNTYLFVDAGTYEEIYNDVFKTQCNSCHNSSDMAGGLDLIGSSKEEVRNNLYGVLPQNETAKNKQHQLLYPGDPYRSMLFRMVNNGLSPNEALETAEDPEGVHTGIEISDYHKELIRQWILWDAKMEGEVVKHDLIEDYYNGNGFKGIADEDIPPVPDPSEGFQIHIGPYFVQPWENGPQPNLEYYSKWETHLPSGLEINRIDAHLGSSHHLILYLFEGDAAADRPNGLRDVANHSNVSYVVGYQQSEDWRLPDNTALFWQEDAVLDMNAHVVNYTTQVLATDMYINVYTQNKGTAKHEMMSQLIPNFNFNIPNDGQEHEFETAFTYNFNFPIYVWNMSSHTHQLATDYDVWLRNPDGTKGEHIFDASKYNGIPECEEIGYDYQHPPTRVFSPFLPIYINEGIIHRAKYINNTDGPVGWGATSNDEMFITGVSFVLDTTDIKMPEGSKCYADEITSVNDTEHLLPNGEMKQQLIVYAYPNPMQNGATTVFINSIKDTHCNFILMDISGKEIIRKENFPLYGFASNQIHIQQNDLKQGMYIYTLTDKTGKVVSGKLMVK